MLPRDSQDRDHTETAQTTFVGKSLAYTQHRMFQVQPLNCWRIQRQQSRSSCDRECPRSVDALVVNYLVELVRRDVRNGQRPALTGAQAFSSSVLATRWPGTQPYSDTTVLIEYRVNFAGTGYPGSTLRHHA